MKQEICSICWSPEVNHTTICNHKFCESCISRWLLEHNTCPNCRTELYPLNNINEDSPFNLTNGGINIVRINSAYDSIFQEYINGEDVSIEILCGMFYIIIKQYAINNFENKKKLPKNINRKYHQKIYRFDNTNFNHNVTRY